MKNLSNILGYRTLHRTTFAVALFLFAITGLILLLATRATAPFTSLDLGTGSTIAPPALIVSNDTAAGGSYVQFGPASPGEPSSGICTGRDANGGVPADKFPGAACTGWQGTGVTLTKVTPNWDIFGDGSRMGYRITEDNVTIDGIDFDVFVCVIGNNVTIKRSRIRAAIDMVKNYGGCWDATKVATNLTLIDVEIDGGRSYSQAALGSDMDCTRCNIHSSGVGQTGANFTMVDSYVHDLFGKTDCQEFPGDCISHNEAVLGCCNNIIIRHSNLEGVYHPESQGGGMSSALSLYSWSPFDNALIERNRFKSVAVYCVYGGYTHDLPGTTNVRFIDNVFIKNASSGTCGMGGPIAGWLRGSGNVWQNNRFDDEVVIHEP